MSSEPNRGLRPAWSVGGRLSFQPEGCPWLPAAGTTKPGHREWVQGDWDGPASTPALLPAGIGEDEGGERLGPPQCPHDTQRGGRAAISLILNHNHQALVVTFLSRRKLSQYLESRPLRTEPPGPQTQHLRQ